jgi:hypothetical protein
MDTGQLSKLKAERRLAKKAGLVPVETTEKSVVHISRTEPKDEQLHREHGSGDSLHYGWIAPDGALSEANSATTATDVLKVATIVPDLGMKDPTLGINGADILPISPKPMGAIVSIQVELSGNTYKFTYGVPDLLGAIHGFTEAKLKEKLRDALKSQFGQRIK